MTNELAVQIFVEGELVDDYWGMSTPRVGEFVVRGGMTYLVEAVRHVIVMQGMTDREEIHLRCILYEPEDS